ncbi:conserved hypothetical exported protein [Taylorella asinigenitalis 14/45]|uniref:Conserved hypothetical exported protein n=1 Tax=Taylorella asinigenitalis 14/45 TaxID=1091495 RepID=I7IKG1_9BURK|nr:DUF1850 domain-containing protein [Taylorella asinigenitalis]CCG19172.1 conserved hypothetical exported protein [Taylorella asinigenitalis 14/45]
MSKIRLILICASLLVLALFYPINRAKISYLDKSCLLSDGKFSLSWVHSVEHETWIENYEAKYGYLLLESTYLKTFGAGTPSDGEVIDAPKGFIGYKVNRKIPMLNWVVSQNMQGSIIADGHDWVISKEVPRFTEVHIESISKPFIKMLFGGFCNDK